MTRPKPGPRSKPIDWDFVQRMIDAGVPIRRVAKVVGVSDETVKTHCIAGYRETRVQQNREARARRRGTKPSSSARPYTIDPDDAMRALASVPADTRSFTERALGDPLPGRSALDRRSSP